MADKFDEKLIKVLKKDLRLVDEETGELIPSEIVTLALKIDHKLIALLLQQAEIKKKFFSQIEKHWIFEINKFIEYIQDKNFLNNSYTKFKNKIGLNIDGKFLNERKEVALVWPFKDCILEGGMTKEDQKRNEIFFNEVLAQDEIDRLFDPKALTSFKRYTANGEEAVKGFKRDENGTIKDNLIIKGNNLLALHSLKKEFQGKVKLIYIDPPYNTGGNAETFTYNNNFNHSTWLTFMKNRLEVAKDFLREDGFLAIAIDHFELFYLGAIADEVFGRENRLGIITVVHKPEGRQFANFFSSSNEFMMVYSRNKSVAEFENVILEKEKQDEFDKEDEEGAYKLKNFIRLTDGKYSLRKNKPEGFYPIYVSNDLNEFSLTKKQGYEEVLPITDRGVERVWKTFGNTFMGKVKDGQIVAKRKNGRIVLYEKLRASQVFTTHWVKKKYHSYHFGTKLLEDILGKKQFSFPKSIFTVIDTLKIMTGGDDIIMDFFGGSGTTAHATLELNKEDGGNRQFILIEQLDTHMEAITKRMSAVIKSYTKEKNLYNFSKNDSFIYYELDKYNEKAIDKIESAKDTRTLFNLWNEMCEHYFLNYDVDINKFNADQQEFEKLPLEKQKKLLVEMLNKNQLYVNLSEMDDSQFKVSKEDKELNKKFYQL